MARDERQQAIAQVQRKCGLLADAAVSALEIVERLIDGIERGLTFDPNDIAVVRDTLPGVRADAATASQVINKALDRLRRI